MTIFPSTICYHNKLIGPLAGLPVSTLSPLLIILNTAFREILPQLYAKPSNGSPKTQNKCQSRYIISSPVLNLWCQHPPSAATYLLQPWSSHYSLCHDKIHLGSQWCFLLSSPLSWLYCFIQSFFKTTLSVKPSKFGLTQLNIFL